MSSRTLRLTLIACVSCASLASAGGVMAGTAQATTGHWGVFTTSAPTNLAPGGEGEIVASVENRSAEDVLATPSAPVKIIDTVPAGLEIVSGGVRASAKNGAMPRDVPNLIGPEVKQPSCTVEGQVVICEATNTIAPYNGAEIAIKVKVAAAEGTLVNKVRVEGAGSEATEAPLESSELHVSATPVIFGAEHFEIVPENENGTRDTQAGSHPFQLTTVLDFNEAWEALPLETAKEADAPEGGRGQMRNLNFVLPPGLVGDVNAVPQCTSADFATIATGDFNECPDDTAIGVARISLLEPSKIKGVLTDTVPVFNLVPAAGEPARFGIEVDKVPIVLGTSVRTGSDYAVEVHVVNSTQTAAVLQTIVTFWGVPGAAAHDKARGWACIGDEFYREDVVRPCTALNEQNPPAFLDMPTQCATQPSAEVTGESWNQRKFEAKYTFPQSFSGCELLGFSPSFELKPETEEASTPTGMTVNVKLPQTSTLSPSELAESDLEQTTITLPEGMQSSPGAANGLAACGAGGFGLLEPFPEKAQLENDHFAPGVESCPEASRIGSVRIKTPLLPHELNGSVYLADQDTNLAEEQLVLYLTAYDPASGVRVKLAGNVHLDPSTGRLTSTFSNSPPVPFEELEVKFFGGSDATQSTPPLCGSQKSESKFVPWSGQATAEPTSSFNISKGAEGKGCETSYPQSFSPSVQAGSTNQQAGAYTDFSLVLHRPDSDQAVSGLSVKLPEGVAGMLSSVTPCPEPAAGQEWHCGSESLLGEAIESSGLGGSPFTLHGTVYITTGYDGAPFGLLVSTPAIAGPFNLGIVNVRSRINVDPETAAVTITTDPGPHGDGLPTMLKGVPVQLKELNVLVTRPNFQFNPTNCNPLAVTTTVMGSQGGSSTSSYPFHATNCAALPFAPKLTATVVGHGSRVDGTSFNVKIESPGFGQADIRKVFLTIPKELPSRLETLHKACTQAKFEVGDGANCSAESIIGHATVHTPVLRAALKGPAYLVSHGNAAFPDVEFVLQGEGITLVLDGKTDIKNGYTYSRFETAPDAPFTSFETELPAGPHSILAAYANGASEPYDICSTKLEMPTEITAQDGLLLHQTTKIKALGCGGVLGVKYTKKQLLAKALKACKKDKKKKKREQCERAAHKKYGPPVKKKSKKSPKKH